MISAGGREGGGAVNMAGYGEHGEHDHSRTPSFIYRRRITPYFLCTPLQNTILTYSHTRCDRLLFSTYVLDGLDHPYLAEPATSKIIISRRVSDLQDFCS